MSASMLYATLDGDFDGNAVLANFEGALAVPDVDPDIGFAIGIGYRGESYSFEFSFQRVEHDSNFLGFPLDTSSNSVNFNFKWHFLTHYRVQPHLLIGAAFPFVIVEDGSVSADGEVDDASLVGLGANLGGGVSYYVTRRMAVVVEGGYRLAVYTLGFGAGDASGSLDEALDGSGFFLTAGISFVLGN